MEISTENRSDNKKEEEKINLMVIYWGTAIEFPSQLSLQMGKHLSW